MWYDKSMRKTLIIIGVLVFVITGIGYAQTLLNGDPRKNCPITQHDDHYTEWLCRDGTRFYETR